MSEYNTTIAYHVMGLKIELFSDQTAYGWSAIAEVNNEYYRLGDRLINLQTAVHVWELINNKKLSPEEVELIAIENGLRSQAI